MILELELIVGRARAVSATFFAPLHRRMPKLEMERRAPEELRAACARAELVCKAQWLGRPSSSGPSAI